MQIRMKWPNQLKTFLQTFKEYYLASYQVVKITVPYGLGQPMKGGGGGLKETKEKQDGPVGRYIPSTGNTLTSIACY